MKVERPETCPTCDGEITFGFGLAAGGVQSEDGTVPGAYWMCLECDWMGPSPQKTICFPDGLVRGQTGA